MDGGGLGSDQITNLTNSNDSSNTDHMMWKGDSFSIIGVSITSLLLSFVFLSNIILGYILWRAKSARKIKNGYYGYYLINICTIDLLAATIYTICTVLFKFQEGCEFEMYSRIYSSLHILFSSAWIATVAVMVMERFVVTRNPLLKRKSLRRLKYKLYLAWLWAILNSLPQLLWYDYITIEPKWFHPMLRMITIFVIPSLLIIISSAGVLTHSSSESALSLRRKKGHQRFVHFTFLLWLTFICCSLPKLQFEFQAKDHDCSDEHLYFLLVSWAIYLIAPILYVMIHAKLLKNELMKQRSNYNPERRNSLPSFRKHSTDQRDFEIYSTRALIQNMGVLDSDLLHRLSIDIPSDEGRKTSILVENMRKYSIFNADMRKTCRKQSMFRRRSSATPADNIFLPLPIPYEHSVNTLNQKVPLLGSTRGKVKITEL